MITNTCITAGNAAHLPGVAELILREGVREARFWAFVEFGDVGQSSEHVRHTDAAPFLRRALDRLIDADVDVRVSWFPACLLGEHADRVENHRSFTLIHREFSSRLQAASRFSCAHAEACTRFPRDCVGLHERYVERFGDERDALHPTRGPRRGAAALIE